MCMYIYMYVYIFMYIYMLKAAIISKGVHKLRRTIVNIQWHVVLESRP